MERDGYRLTGKAAMERMLAIAAGFSFYVLCMILPLVGPTGSRVPHAPKNRATFLSVLMLTLILSGSSVFLAFQRRQVAGGALPWFSLGLSAVCIVFLLILFVNGFAI